MANRRPNRTHGVDKSVRLFENPILERLTRVHPVVPLVIWGPLSAWLLIRAVTVHGTGAAGLAMIGVAGLLTWTLVEYLLHRFVFHYEPESETGKKLAYLFHGVHHDTPQDSTRLLMPPTGAAPILAMIWLFVELILPHPWAQPFIGFFIIGYLVYDYIHYATHFLPMRHPLLKFLKHYHMRHHFSGEDARYGVSSPLWDWVFGTYPAGAARTVRR